MINGYKNNPGRRTGKESARHKVIKPVAGCQLTGRENQISKRGKMMSGKQNFSHKDISKSEFSSVKMSGARGSGEKIKGEGTLELL